MIYAVIVLPTAERDLDQILIWLNQRSQIGAMKWLNRWDDIVLSLADQPERCGLAPESENHPIPIRQIIFRTRKGNPYRALFTVKDHEVFVIHIRGMGQRSVEKISFPINE